MIRRIFITAFFVLCYANIVMAQNIQRRTDFSNQYTLSEDLNENELGRSQNNAYGDERHGTNRMTWGRDTTKHDKPVPIGIFQWTINHRLGTVIPAENNDTTVKHYSNFNNTDGYNGEHSYLGNLGAARLSRIFMNRQDLQPFFFLQPLSYSLTPLEDFRFSNTLSPLTNLSYHSCGNRQTGEDRVRAYFASNINKISGIGFKVDYLYGRGYYNSSQNSIFNSNIFGYYRGERYEMHAWTDFGHQKNAENGGIEDDKYIRNPQSFPQSYGSKDIPTMLSETYNRNDFQTYYLTHRYNLGYSREIELPDSLKPQMPKDKELLQQLSDSIRLVLESDSVQRLMVLDSLKTKWANSIIPPTEFIPVSSIIHTFEANHLNHRHYGYDTPKNYYTNHYYGDINNIKDNTQALIIKNTVGLSVNEGFKKWAKMGITAFASHKYERHTLPTAAADTISGLQTYKENHISIGGEISKAYGKFLHYNANGEITLAGDDIGEFNVDGTADLNIPIGKRDTVQVAAHAFIMNQRPDFYLEHYHSQSAWWDKELDMEKRMRIEGTLSNQRSRTSITLGFENLAKYSYLGIQKTLLEGADATSTKSTDYSHAVRVMQASKNIQILSATLKQDFTVGPLNWENEFTFQTTSSEEALPLPKFNAYTNLYLLFRIAKVLRVELGADMRYFTKYYAPDYAPNLGQFAVQDASTPRVQIGHYPIINAYANLHIKHCRIYFKVNHVNAGTGNMFLAPHYPINPMTIHWGVSWNFFN
ncbi:MAG: putative porin [Bacteroidales bacterium]|nr:putative porin [Bacteroidales bacterium]